MSFNEIAAPARIPALVAAEYDAKIAALPAALAAFEQAVADLKSAATIRGHWGQETIAETHGIDIRTLEASLLRSGWVAVWSELKAGEVASANDKRLWEQTLAKPAPLTLANLRETFRRYLENPRATILRGLAEVFADLDQAYKSHEKVKVGVSGLPKRVILSAVGGYGGYSHGSYGRDKLRDILNAIAAYQGKPLLTGEELSAILSDGDALRYAREAPDPLHRHKSGEPHKMISYPARGVWLKRFGNGNGHLFFSPEALSDINRALAEYYGDVLADCPDDEAKRPAKRESTAVSKDLQFYPTPKSVVCQVLADIGDIRGKRVLDPSCGEGAILDGVRGAGAIAMGIEVDQGRAMHCKAKGYSVLHSNFLEVQPSADMQFDAVVMNPPFSGRHYAKHVTKATQMLKAGGVLVAILPVTAQTDHGLLGQDWAKANGMKLCAYHGRDGFKSLPMGSFRESGTNINTVVFRAYKQ